VLFCRCRRGDSLQRLPGQLGADGSGPCRRPGALKQTMARGLLEAEESRSYDQIHGPASSNKALADRFTETLAGWRRWVRGSPNAPPSPPKTDKEAIRNSGVRCGLVQAPVPA